VATTHRETGGAVFMEIKRLILYFRKQVVLLLNRIGSHPLNG